MGNSQSSRMITKTDAPGEQLNRSSENVRGRKSPTADIVSNSKSLSIGEPLVSTTSSGSVDSSDAESTEDQYEVEESDEEIESGLTERRQILEDAKMLKMFATFHLHPEMPVMTTDPFAKGRNYSNRPSAPNTESFEEAEERARILEETKQLRMYAGFHLHPEKPVTANDAYACARNFFSRASAAEQDSQEAAEERAIILEEASMLKQYAQFHLHPEKPVESQVDPTSFGRNYFSRPSAEDQLEEDEAEEREKILEEVALLKQYAAFHLHPEKAVTTTDATVCARNYYTRASADEYFDEDEAEEREMILAEVAELKKVAGYHLHPERPVETNDATMCARNYFTRASADEYFDEDEADERELVLAEAAELKKVAGYHLHPEKPVESQADPTAFARNYFARASAVEQESLEELEERVAVLAEAAELKKFAGYHLHPEKPVETTDSTACGRNYFSRASADDYFDEDEADEREQILAEAAELKKVAGFHLHPERPVETTDATLCARNYFTRASADEYFDEDEADERELVLAEAAELKKVAGYHLHPERPVDTTDATACARNYFTRASADEYFDEDEADEREFILAEAAELKKVAGYHLHPERPVESSDATAFGRNFFYRASAEEQESQEESAERAKILEETAMLKKYAEFHLHPEKPVVTADSMACARNFFTRASADEYFDEDEVEEREMILAEVSELKKVAGYHLHPERPVEATDSTACGRNYFTRASADEYFDEDEADEREQILAEAAELKKIAGFHLHPEKPVVTTDANVCGRNFFTRASADEYFDQDEVEEREQILSEIAELKKVAGYHLHPERPVETTDATACARNYFARASAEEQLTKEEVEEREQILVECLTLKKYAEYHLHPEKPVESADATAGARNYFSRASAQSNDELIVSEGHAIHEDNFYDADEEVQDDSYGHTDFEEDLSDFGSFRASLTKVISERLAENDYLQPIKMVDGPKDEEEEGNLSRSPSSIMLFGYEENQAF